MTKPKDNRISCRDEDILLRPAEAAMILGVSPRTLQFWRTEDKRKKSGPPYVFVGRAVRYHRASLREWVRRRKGR